MNKLSLVIFFFSIMVVASLGYAENSGSLPLLKMAPDARSVAMGESGVAGSENAFAAFHNPALLGYSTHSQASFAYSDWLLDLSLQSAALQFDYKQMDVALSFNVFNTPGIEKRVLPSDDPLATFSAHDLATGLSLAYLYNEHLSFGVTGRYLYQQIDVNNASGWSTDLGLAYRLDFHRLTIAVAGRNFGEMNALISQSAPLPKDISFGISGEPAKLENFTIVGQLDGQYLLDDDLRFHAGIELGWQNHVFLRAGYQTGSEIRTVSGGLGLAWQRFHFDYAYQPLQEGFQASHRFAFSLDF
jgi:hypothetical protein